MCLPLPPPVSALTPYLAPSAWPPLPAPPARVLPRRDTAETQAHKAKHEM